MGLITFISLMHPARPKMQRRMTRSVMGQAGGWEHIRLETGVTDDMPAMCRLLTDAPIEIAGKYTYILDDDDELMAGFVTALDRFTVHQRPHWIMVMAKLGGPDDPLDGIWPRRDPNGAAINFANPADCAAWEPGDEPGRVSTLNLVIRTDVFMEHRAACGSLPADYNLARSMWDAGIRPVWLNVLAARTQKISKGRGE